MRDTLDIDLTEGDDKLLAEAVALGRDIERSAGVEMSREFFALNVARHYGRLVRQRDAWDRTTL